MIKLTKKQQAVLDNYKTAKLEYENVFTPNFYKNQIKKLFGNEKDFQIEKNGDYDSWIFWIIFYKNEDYYSIGIYKDSIEVRCNHKLYYVSELNVEHILNFLNEFKRIND